MPLYALGDREPQIDPEAFVHPDAVLIGDVRIGPESTIWPTAVLRGDEMGIVVGARSSVQDGSIIHCTEDKATTIGDDCTIGHNVHMEGCEIHNKALIGSGSVVLPFAIIGEEAIVGANAVVIQGMQVPSRAMALGIPAKIREDAVKPGDTMFNAEVYVKRGHFYRENLRLL
ncbi:MAG: gamma carbonic anhydrase family protein [Acidimicrobiales bacterium]